MRCRDAGNGILTMSDWMGWWESRLGLFSGGLHFVLGNTMHAVSPCVTISVKRNVTCGRGHVNKNRDLRNLFPAWNMPSDPVRAVFWFMRWLLKVLVRFFWIPLLVMVILEGFLNWKAGGTVTSGIVASVITLLVGLVIWAVLFVVSLFLNVSTNVSRIISDAHHVQQELHARRSAASPFDNYEPPRTVVEGTITDLEEERKKRRRE